MKTLKISLIATIAMIAAWALHIPHRVWPGHPQFADFVMGLVLCLVLQFAWPNPNSEPKS